MYHLSIKSIHQVSYQIVHWIKLNSFHPSDIKIGIFRKYIQGHLEKVFCKIGWNRLFNTFVMLKSWNPYTKYTKFPKPLPRKCSKLSNEIYIHDKYSYVGILNLNMASE